MWLSDSTATRRHSGPHSKENRKEGSGNRNRILEVIGKELLANFILNSTNKGDVRKPRLKGSRGKGPDS